MKGRFYSLALYNSNGYGFLNNWYNFSYIGYIKIHEKNIISKKIITQKNNGYH